MPKGIFARTKEHGKAISEGLKGHFVSEESRKKQSKAMKGRKLSEETKRKLSEAHKGNKCPWAGKVKHSLEHRKNMSKAIKGEKHWNWKGGITPLIFQIRCCFEYRQWHSDVLTKGYFTCQECGQRGGKLEVDHYPKSFSKIMREYQIKTFEQALDCEEFWNINNGRILCKKCHKLTDNWAGKSNKIR